MEVVTTERKPDDKVSDMGISENISMLRDRQTSQMNFCNQSGIKRHTFKLN